MEKRINFFRDYWKLKFGERVQKIPVNAGFSCPNRDGTISGNGCTYCLNAAFSPYYCRPEKGIDRQVREGMTFFRQKYNSKKFIVYFQAFSGTHSSVDLLREIFSSALEIPGIAGLIVATRPDCVDKEKLEMLSGLGPGKFVGIELGIESCKNSTLQRLNRGHTFEQTVQAISLIHKFGIHLGGHLILGLPGETRQDNLNAAGTVSTLGLFSLKIHHLQILKGTAMDRDFARRRNDFDVYSLEGYIELLADFLEILSPEIMIDRLCNQSPRDLLVSPIWGGVKNGEFLSSLNEVMVRRQTWQGRLFNKTKIE